MKIFKVQESYDNGLLYEDHDWHNNAVIALCATRQRAKDYITGIPLPKETLSEEEKWIEGEPYPHNPKKCERQFYVRRYYNSNTIERIWYTIKEQEVLE